MLPLTRQRCQQIGLPVVLLILSVGYFIISTTISSSKKSNVLDEMNLFSKDHVPEVYRKPIIANDTIHICIVAAGMDSFKEVEILIKSILVHSRRSDVMFHFVTDNEPDQQIAKLFDNIDPLFVKIIYKITTKTDLKQYLHKKLGGKLQMIHPYSGIYGAGKIFMYSLLSDVERCIIVDTDIVFAADPAFLWYELQSKLQPPVAIAVTMGMKDKQFNSGLMLQNLQLLRSISFGNLISMTGCKRVPRKGDTEYKYVHDQVLLNTMMNENRDMFDNTLTLSWNLGRCFNFRGFTFTSFEDKTKDLFFGAAHFSCIPLKYSNAIEGFKQIRKWHTLQKYIQYLEETDFKNGQWNKDVV